MRPILLRPAFPSNYRAGRSADVKGVVIHTTEASFESACSWFGMDHRPFGKDPTSAHYVVAQDGRIARCVDDAFTAFHAGNFQTNLCTIGIEVEGHAADPATWSEPALEALVELCAELVREYQLPVNRAHFFGHNEVPDPYHLGQFGGVGHNEDPGPFFPWLDFMARLTAATTQGVVA
jgi:N-acetyl-anhydromuramyl-L-alanine amidase AmpD